MHIDAVDLEVVKASLSGIVREMQNSLFRTGFSTIVRESQDASCALLNDLGEVIVIELSPQGCRELTRTSVLSFTWSHPAFAEGCLFARTDREIVCVPLPTK